MRLAEEPAHEVDEAAGPRRHRLAMHEGVEVVGQLRRARIAMFRPLLQAFAADQLKVDIDLRIEQPRPDRLLRAYQEQRLDSGCGEERWPARDHLVEDS